MPSGTTLSKLFFPSHDVATEDPVPLPSQRTSVPALSLISSFHESEPQKIACIVAVSFTPSPLGLNGLGVSVKDIIFSWTVAEWEPWAHGPVPVIVSA